MFVGENRELTTARFRIAWGNYGEAFRGAGRTVVCLLQQKF
jgi:hypothetical protein